MLFICSAGIYYKEIFNLNKLMCGIFGIVQKNQVSRKKLTLVSNILRHRGPDDEGYLLFNNSNYREYSGRNTTKEIKLINVLEEEILYNAAFLHRRLSIIDLTASGHQPMSYDSERFWITYNGEIYNYLELRNELQNLGYCFHTNSDTEVILAAYKAWGFDCVKHFNGMWAFALWDRNKSLIFLSRDRFGIKPLFYYKNNGQFIFCSEIKGIREYLDRNLTLDEKQIYHFAVKGELVTGNSEQTIYREVKQLMPGHNLIYKDNTIKLEKYWELHVIKNKLLIQENVDKFITLFYNSIKYRLRSDVEVGSCLSGGLDSSSIVSYGSKEFDNRFHTFSIIWPGEKCDESFFVNKVNKKWNCHAHAFEPNLEKLLFIIEKEIWHQEIPLGGASLIAQWFVMEEAKKNGIKVLLDGQGGDEVLSGYPRYLIPYINEMIFHFKWGELIKHYASLKKAGYNFKKFLKIQMNRILMPNNTALPISDIFEKRYSSKYKYSPYKYNFLPKYLKDEIEKSCLPTLLHIEDRNSMAHSVEARIPFLDHELVEFCVSIPSEQKIFGSLTKIILREAMKEYLPTEIYRRTDKIGFETPIEERLLSRGGKLHEGIWAYIKRSELWKMDILDKSKLEERNHERLGFPIFSLARFIDIWS